MARFEDFTKLERHVLREAMTWAQSEFYDPGHTAEEQDALQALIHEAKEAELPPETTTEGIEEMAQNGKRGRQTTAKTPAASSRKGGRPEERQSTGKTSAAHKGGGGAKDYLGFLYLQCAECGNIHAFCARRPMSAYRCARCGAVTPLADLTKLSVVCECGRSYRYLTNMEAQQMDVACFNCGMPVAVEWNSRAGQYTTIGANTRRGGGRK